MTEATRRFVKLALWFAALHWGLVLLVRFFIHLATGVPPTLAGTDRLLIVLTELHQTLLLVRTGLRTLWPVESVPMPVNLLFTLLNSAAWGTAVALVKTRIRIR